MLEHPIIDVAIGLVLFYLVLSLVASAVQEWIASLFGLRSKNLRKGIERFLGDDYARKVYEHPLIRNLAKEGGKPSYIDTGILSTALLEIVSEEKGDGKSYYARTKDDVREMIDSIPNDNPLRKLLGALADETGEAADNLKQRLAGWFDEGMTRISGWYNRQSKVIIFVIAAVIVVAANAGTIDMARELWINDALRSNIAAQAEEIAGREDLGALQGEGLGMLETFPIGWDNPPESFGGWVLAVLGWLMTIAAVSLGAPFWFDLLGRITKVKGSGGESKEGAGKKRA